jgi:hypothetical protein
MYRSYISAHLKCKMSKRRKMMHIHKRRQIRINVFNLHSHHRAIIDHFIFRNVEFVWRIKLKIDNFKCEEFIIKLSASVGIRWANIICNTLFHSIIFDVLRASSLLVALRVNLRYPFRSNVTRLLAISEEMQVTAGWRIGLTKF